MKKEEIFNPKKKKTLAAKLYIGPKKQPELEVKNMNKSEKNKDFFAKKLREDYGLKVETKKIPKKSFIKTREVFEKLKKIFKGQEFSFKKAWKHLSEEFEWSGRNQRLRKLDFYSKLRRMIQNTWLKKMEKDGEKKYKIFEKRL